MLSNMKWQNPGITFIGGGGSSGGSSETPGATPTSQFTSSLEGLAGQTFATQEALDAAETAENQRLATQGAVDTAASTTQAVAADPTAALSTGQQNVTNLEAQIAQLTPQLADNPELQTQIDSLTEQANAERIKLVQAQQLASQQQTEAQRALTTAAMTDPGALIKQAEVATTQVTPDQLVDVSMAQMGPAEQAQVSTVGETATAETPARQEASKFDAALTEGKVTDITEGMEAATAEPSAKATVRGQLEMLMSDFEGGETPPWASGPMRQAMGIMQARGMGASSMAGAAVVQAAMESALSIAVQDATTTAQFEMQNLNNEQQTTIFKTQQRLAGLFSDQAALNASAQFNASSENQTNQFFSNLEAASSQFNANQINSIRQFNANAETAISQFNTQQREQRAQFETANSLVISQSNAQWRQNTATAATAAQNVANLEYTRNANAITGASLDQIWQRERDLLDFAFTASESAADRANNIIIQKLSASETREAIKMQTEAATDTAKGRFLSEITTQILELD